MRYAPVFIMAMAFWYSVEFFTSAAGCTFSFAVCSFGSAVFRVSAFSMAVFAVLTVSLACVVSAFSVVVTGLGFIYTVLVLTTGFTEPAPTIIPSDKSGNADQYGRKNETSHNVA